MVARRPIARRSLSPEQHADAPALGAIVEYELTADDAKDITARRRTSSGREARMAFSHARGLSGSDVKEGDIFPLIVTKVEESGVYSGQVFLDGDDTYWVQGIGADAATGVPPVNTNVPMVFQNGAAMECTMGNWGGDPDTYIYQWKLDGVDVGTATEVNQYTIVAPGDVGKSATCVVTATNESGTTIAPESNAVVIADPAGV